MGLDQLYRDRVFFPHLVVRMANVEGIGRPRGGAPRALPKLPQETNMSYVPRGTCIQLPRLPRRGLTSRGIRGVRGGGRTTLHTARQTTWSSDT